MKISDASRNILPDANYNCDSVNTLMIAGFWQDAISICVTLVDYKKLCHAFISLMAPHTETQDEKAENAEERKRRKAFYLRNGLKETGLFVNVYDTDFELLTPDGELTFWEYVDFLREVMYEEYVEILRPTLIAMKKK